jgi:hypothetical protein
VSGCREGQSNRDRNCWSKIATSPSSASRVVAAVSADEADASAVLVREDSPSVDLLLVDPAVAVKRFADLRRGPSECTGREVGGAGSMAHVLVMHRQRFHLIDGVSVLQFRLNSSGKRDYSCVKTRLRVTLYVDQPPRQGRRYACERLRVASNASRPRSRGCSGLSPGCLLR